MRRARRSALCGWVAVVLSPRARGGRLGTQRPDGNPRLVSPAWRDRRGGRVPGRQSGEQSFWRVPGMTSCLKASLQHSGPRWRGGGLVLSGAGHTRAGWGLGTGLLLRALRRIYTLGRPGARRLPVPSAMVRVRKAKPPRGQGREGSSGWSSVRQQGAQGVRLGHPALRRSRSGKRLGASPQFPPRSWQVWGAGKLGEPSRHPAWFQAPPGRACLGPGSAPAGADQGVCISRRAAKCGE